MLRVRLPSDWLKSAPSGEPNRESGNDTAATLVADELCTSSFSRACAARRALQQARTPSAIDTSASKKPRLGAAVPASSSAAASQTSEPSSDSLLAAADVGTADELAVLLVNCRVLDPVEGAYLDGLHQVLLRGGIILEVRPMGSESQLPPGPTVGVEVDCGGAVLMPGLCDAHVHCTAVTANLAGLMSLPESYVATKSVHILAGMLARGFTTIRDAGGADFGLAQAVDEGLVLGPRILFTGHALSQTGGHGDFRGRGEDLCACGAALRGIGRVCDGDAEVRRAARDELRRGAHCIKVMASGGVASPTDRLTNTQFSEAELTAIVEEAAAAGTYVCAHAYTPAAIKRAVRCGVSSIEHGNYLDEPTAQLMSQKRVFLVPTIVTYQEIARRGAAAGMPEELVEKVGDAVDAGLRSLSVARQAGVTVCFGSDLLGDMHPAQAGEFELRARVLPAADILRSATIHCAKLFGLQKSIGQVRPGYRADLVLLWPGLDPLADVRALAAPGGAAIAAVFKEGLLAKAPAVSRGGAAAGATMPGTAPAWAAAVAAAAATEAAVAWAAAARPATAADATAAAGDGGGGGHGGSARGESWAASWRRINERLFREGCCR